MSRIVFREKKRRGDVSLNVTSLVDVLFLLLIFFTLTSTFKRAGQLDLKLPESTTAGARGVEDNAKPMELVLTEHGTLLLDGAPTTMEQLLLSLQSARERQPDRAVMIEAEENVRHGQIVRLLDAVRTAGFKGVGIGVLNAPAAAGAAPAAQAPAH